MSQTQDKISNALNTTGTIAILVSGLLLAGTTVVDDEMGQAFLLGAFFSGLAGAILSFVISKLGQRYLEGFAQRFQLGRAG